jgi:hypothetical protein
MDNIDEIPHLPNVPVDVSVPIHGQTASSLTNRSMAIGYSPKQKTFSATPSPLNPEGAMFHCMLSYRVNTDSEIAKKLHDKLHTMFRVSEDQGTFSLKRTRSSSITAAAATVSSGNPRPPVMKDGSFTRKGLYDSEDFPYKDQTTFPDEYDQCPEASGSSLNVFLDKVCLKQGKNWEGSGTERGGGFIGAVLQCLVFVPILSVKQGSVSKGFEVVPSPSGQNNNFNPGNEYNWSKLEGSVGQLIRLNNAEHLKVDNVLLELIIARILNEIESVNKTYACVKILPFLVGGEMLFACAEKCSDEPHFATNEKVLSVLTTAFGLSQSDKDALFEKLMTFSVRSVIQWYFKSVPSAFVYACC